MSAEASPAAPVVKRRAYFRGASSQPQISSEAAAREGAILRLAAAALGLKGAQEFLNGPNDQLDGRPLSIAANSTEGYEAVVAVIASIAPAALGATVR